MRIAILGDYPLDPGKIWGGEQAAFSYLVRELCKIPRLEVHVVTLSGSARDGLDRPDESGATLHVIPRLPRLDLYRRYRVYQARVDEKLEAIQPDVVHGQGAIHHGCVALGSRYPAVITVHGVQSEDCKHQKTLYLRWRKRFTGWWIERHNLKRTRYLIAIGRYVTDYFSRILRPDARVYHIPNAIDGRFFDLWGAAERSAPNVPDGGAPTVLYAGRVIQRKRVLQLVQAFARIAREAPSAQLRIAGEMHSEAEYAGRIRRLVQSEGLEERVLFLGALQEDAVLEEYACCDLLALPSAQETTPMVIAQAMAAGKPVIATPVGGVVEMVKNGETGLLASVDDVDGLGEALLQLLRDPALRRRMGDSGRAFAVENYRADSVARRTHEVYTQMVEAGR